jgi:hypothetical protein
MKGRAVNTVLQSATDVQELYAPCGLQEMEWQDEVETAGEKDPQPVTVSVRELLSADEMIRVRASSAPIPFRCHLCWVQTAISGLDRPVSLLKRENGLNPK